MEHGAVVREMKQHIADLWEDLRSKRVVASKDVRQCIPLEVAQRRWNEEVPTLCAAIKALTVEVPERCTPRA